MFKNNGFTRIVFYLFLAALFFYQEKSFAIVNGKPVASGSHQEVVHLFQLAAKKDVKINEQDYLAYAVQSCSGIFISSGIVLTAGHCVTPQFGSVYLYNHKTHGFAKSLTTYSEYDLSELESKKPKDENPLAPPDDPMVVNSNLESDGAVEGCTLTPQPVLKTKTLDLALVVFPQDTGKNIADINVSYLPAINNLIEYAGFGAGGNPLVSSLAFFEDLFAKDMKLGQSKLWRFNNQRIAIKNKDSETYATIGDSGGPFYVDGRVVAITSTMQPHCETKWGEDYGIVNTATLLSSPEARAFLQKASFLAAQH